jgi:hypothetical protein
MRTGEATVTPGSVPDQVIVLTFNEAARTVSVRPAWKDGVGPRGKLSPLTEAQIERAAQAAHALLGTKAGDLSADGEPHSGITFRSYSPNRRY